MGTSGPMSGSSGFGESGNGGSGGSSGFGESGGSGGGGQCSQGDFPCGDGFCVPPEWVCDFIVDCQNGSDENPMLCN
jgi:hypothetical protein